MATTIFRRVFGSGDDAVKFYSPVSFGSTGPSLNVGSFITSGVKRACAGMVFRNVLVPQGKVIDTSTMDVWSAGFSTGTVARTKIRAYDADTIVGDLSTEAEWDAIFPGNLTAAEVNWDNIVAFGPDITGYTSPEIKTVIQEIINRPGWASGNDMCLFWDDFDDRSDGDANRRVIAFDRPLLNTRVPRLNITYSDPPSGQVIIF